MNINWINKRDKNEVYKVVMDFCQENSFTKENSSFVTLLLPPGNFSTEQEVKIYLNSLVQEFDAPAIISIEPVIPGNDLGTMSLLKMYGKYRTELLPFYHAHILVKDDCLDSIVLRNKWNEIVGSKLQKLFRFGPVEKSIREVVNYITKFFEEKRGGNCQIGFVAQDEPMTNEGGVEFYNYPIGVLRSVKTIFKKLIRYYFQIPFVTIEHQDKSLSIHEKDVRAP